MEQLDSFPAKATNTDFVDSQGFKGQALATRPAKSWGMGIN